MIIPPLLIAASLIFWGLESGNLLLGSILAISTGGAMFFQQRWTLTDEDCVQVSDFTSVIFISTTALILLNVDKIVLLKTLVIWQPLVLIPLLLAQLYSGRENIIIRTRLGFNRKRTFKHEPLDFRLYYFPLTLLSAAMANSRSELFFPGGILLFFWLLFVNRGRSFSAAAFAGLFLLTAITGYLGVKGAERLHEYVNAQIRRHWRGYFSSQYADPFQATLTFGSVGRLKTSGEIFLRLKTDGIPPPLLKQASYDLLGKNIWIGNQTFAYLPVEDMAWDLIPRPHPPGAEVTIEYYLPKEKGLLPQPYGSFQVKGETLYELEQNVAGTVKVVDGAPLVTYEISYVDNVGRKSDQSLSRNLVIPVELEQLLAKVTEDWHTTELQGMAKVQQVKHYFADGFTYSLALQGRGTFSSALENFLLGSKEGHCEMYATATAMLLRKLGIPSRYVTGFAVSEYSRLEHKYIVRERHAHAWAEAYVDGNWLIVDTTPADWLTIDSRNRSTLEWLQDILAYLRLKYSYFRINTEQNYRLLLSGLVIVLSVILLYRIYSRIRAEKVATAKQKVRRTFPPPVSPFNRIEDALNKIGVPRKTKESFILWARRVNDVHPIDLGLIEKLFEKHRKLRFDPRGMAQHELDFFYEMTGKWLTNHEIFLQNDHQNLPLDEKEKSNS
ncbi:transglutaminase-like domain-containing protein [Desulfopila aestuarii]|uniref:Transglutaminase-like superfamily protein n=1 Tax=Desulfopila aestuarii DSM 18488 TaxID=1121416 RepID=A0A1M7YJ39_9BACT|nr:transglutaminase-like domain-containing protein [Desulfopila aestuarii]SHO52619.1 Transglutaminase-like superfamily protein [Desulfopila aestuarii DSM 18488]